MNAPSAYFKKRAMKKVILICLVTLAACGCTRMYTLPDAPPKAQWQATEEAKESPEDVMKRFLDAKRAAIQCFAALADGRYDTALTWMSAETNTWFDAHSGGKGAAEAFKAKTLELNGENIEFDPVGDVFIRDLTDIRDDFGGRKDEESATRKVLYAVNASGQARELVFVLEEDRWRLDSPHIQTDLLTE